jgi:hypothetical protein
MLAVVVSSPVVDLGFQQSFPTHDDPWPLPATFIPPIFFSGRYLMGLISDTNF